MTAVVDQAEKSMKRGLGGGQGQGTDHLYLVPCEAFGAFSNDMAQKRDRLSDKLGFFCDTL